MTVSIIVAVAENGAIGKNNDLLWHLPNDLKFFKTVTLGHPVIMGRKSYLSIPEKYRPLPGRPNLVVSRDKGFKEEGIRVHQSIESAIESAKELDKQEIFIIGGGQIYKHAISHDLCDRVYFTSVKASFEGDVFFPELDLNKWRETSRVKHNRDEKHAYDYDFVVYDKVISDES